MGDMVRIRGKNLYVEDYGKEHRDTLLYLHGGPGASCVDFCFYQAKALAKSIRVIAFDQRGVLRSDPIELNEPFKLDDLVEDCEALRDKLGVREWSLVGHSFGGYLALKYAYKYPHSIKKIVYETPCFDVKSSMRSLLKAALDLAEIEQKELTEEVRGYLLRNKNAKELWQAWGETIQKLGKNKDNIYLRSIDPEEFNQIYDVPSIAEELWARAQVHTNLLEEEGLFFESLLPLFPLINHPSLLLHGKYDHVCCEHQRKVFKEKSQNGDIVLFENSAHFPRIEEPEKYTYLVERFLLSN